MQISTKLSQRDFINANMVMLYTKPFLKFATGLVVGSCILLLVFSFFVPGIKITSVAIPVLAISAVPLATYFAAKKIYQQTSSLGEKMEYNFIDEHIIIKGETFTGQLAWNKIYKVTKTKNWLLIWQNKQQASPIPRKDVRDFDLPKLAGLLNKHGVTNNL